MTVLKHKLLKLLTLLFFIVSSQALLALETSKTPKKVLVSIQPYALILKELNPSDVEISVLQEASINPHAFQMKPSHLKKIADADLVIWGGEQVEPYLSKAFAKKQQLVLANIPDLVLITDSHEAHDEEHAIDPHIWLSEKNSIAIAKAMAAALDIKLLKNSTPLLTNKEETQNSRPLLLVYHNAYSYLEAELQLQHDFVIYDNHNAKPGLKHWHELMEALKDAKQNQQAVCLISSPAFSESVEAKKLEQKIMALQLKDFRWELIDPMASDKTYENFSAYLNESRDTFIKCMKN